MGAAQEVTGSSYLLRTNEANLLIDFGMFQGKEEDWNYQPLDIDPKDIHAIILTHAHLDHSGRIPVIVKQGYEGPIYATPPTVELTKLLWQDTLKLMKEEKDRLDRKRRRQGNPPVEMLFDEEHMYRAAEMLVAVDWHEEVRFRGVSFTLRPAGHILGASSVEVFADGVKVVFSGDLGPLQEVMEPAPHRFEYADYVVIESTYGDRRHKNLEETRREFKQIIERAILDGGKILIPTFVVDRAQRVLYELALLANEVPELKRLPMFFDSPLGDKITSVYSAFPEYLLPHMADFFKNEVSRGLQFEYIVTPEDSKKLNEIGDALIMAGAGMCTGGRIVHHLKHGLWNPKNDVVFVGYQAVGTLGRSIVDGAKRVTIMGEEVAVRARIHTINGFSAHADQNDLIKWSQAFPKTTAFFVTHGEPEPAKRLAAGLTALGYSAAVPSKGLSVPLTPRREVMPLTVPAAYQVTIGQKLDSIIVKHPEKRAAIERIIEAVLESLGLGGEP